MFSSHKSVSLKDRHPDLKTALVFTISVYSLLTEDGTAALTTQTHRCHLLPTLYPQPGWVSYLSICELAELLLSLLDLCLCDL